ncbi:SpcZ [Streptomyces sp. AGS-58]|uniref:SpcZ n=1 Tax=unclassified Streptomyces TaxID=2593676 RepID=UPI0035A28748
MSRPPAVPASFGELLARLEAGLVVPARPPEEGSSSGPGLPDWLWQVVAVLYDGQGTAAAKDWAFRLHGELGRLGGRVPFTVVHDWHAHAVAPMLAEACARRGWSPQPQRAVQDLHVRALAGQRTAASEWQAVLGPALREAYRLAYAYDDAFAHAYAGAHAYAVANAYGAERAAEFAHGYAELNTGANVTSFADGNALANAGATAVAWAAADAHAYAAACPFAHARVYAHAWAGRERTAVREGTGEREERLRTAHRRLAGGLVDSLARAAA